MKIPYSRVFIDTNILIYAQLTKSPFHEPAIAQLRMFDETGVDLWINRQVIQEYLSVMTRPNTLTEQITVDILTDHAREFEQRFSVAEDSMGVTANLLSLITNIVVSGKQIHDANLVATMLSYGVDHLLTHNVSDFKRFVPLISIIPLIPNADP